MLGSSIVPIGRCTLATAFLSLVLLAPSGAALAQSQEMPPIATPFSTPDFHFSDSARDARYWQLEAESERTLAAFRQSVDAARRTLPFGGRPLGSPAWLQARAAVERAIHDRIPARDALMALIAFVTRERPQLPPAEAEFALSVRHVNEDMLRATNATLIDLLARLAGIRLDEWPA